MMVFSVTELTHAMAAVVHLMPATHALRQSATSAMKHRTAVLILMVPYVPQTQTFALMMYVMAWEAAHMSIIELPVMMVFSVTAVIPVLVGPAQVMPGTPAQGL